MAQATIDTPEIATGTDLIEAYQRGFELDEFIFKQHQVVIEAEREIVDPLKEREEVERVDDIPEGDFGELAGRSLTAHIEKVKLRRAQGELNVLNRAVGEQVPGRKIEIASVSDELKPIQQFYRNMQTGQLDPSKGILGLTGTFPFSSRVNPGRVKGSIVPGVDLASNRLMIRPRRMTVHGIAGDRWQAIMIGGDGEPMVKVEFLD
ncbi:MAG TPA: hypothetical protein VFW77_00065 [Candidatus Saccharimonadales bacterium]|nr:hypothetical protein [Candidatus Saccharimonadales bacterium]